VVTIIKTQKHLYIYGLYYVACIVYAVSVVKRSCVCPSVCLSRRSTAAAAAGGFAAEVGPTVRRSNILVYFILFSECALSSKMCDKHYVRTYRGKSKHK